MNNERWACCGCIFLCFLTLLVVWSLTWLVAVLPWPWA
jgi:hypothetical protein